jgi:hypothetical protein
VHRVYARVDGPTSSHPWDPCGAYVWRQAIPQREHDEVSLATLCWLGTVATSCVADRERLMGIGSPTRSYPEPKRSVERYPSAEHRHCWQASKPGIFPYKPKQEFACPRAGESALAAN